MFTKRSTNLYCIAIIYRYTKAIESRETPLLRRRKQNSPFCLAELFHFSPFLFLRKEEKRPVVRAFFLFCTAFAIYKTFKSALFCRHIFPVLYRCSEREPPSERQTRVSPFLLLFALFHFSPFLPCKRPAEASCFGGPFVAVFNIWSGSG